MITDLRQFYFYEDYVWTPVDFANLQMWIWGAFQDVFGAAFGAAVLQGLQVAPAGGMQVTISAGLGVGDNGEIMVVGSQQMLTVPLPGADNKNYLVILRPITTDETFIPTPDNIAVSVPLHKALGYQLLTLQKTPGFKNDYPSKQSGDVVLMGIQLLAGATVVNTANLDLGIISRIRKQPINVTEVTANYTANPTVDEVIEYDATSASGTVSLPDADTVAGLRLSIIKIDSTANMVAVAAFAGDTISGQATITLDSQWDKVNLYSNGIDWRIL